MLTIITPDTNQNLIIKISEFLNLLFTNTCVNKSVNKNNIEYSILFESFGVLMN